LSSIPLIVGFIGQQGRMSAGRALAVSGLFAVGILVIIAVIGGITAAAGGLLGDIGRYGNYVVAAIFFVVGLTLLDVIPPPWSAPEVGMKRKGLLAAFVLGLVFGIALGPCTFTYMIPLLAITIFKPTASGLHGAILLAAYGLGHCAVLVLAGTSTSLVQKYLNWNDRSRGAVILKRACGALVLAAGVYLIYSAK
jgi:cytochrome c-type biogenesis protein